MRASSSPLTLSLSKGTPDLVPDPLTLSLSKGTPDLVRGPASLSPRERQVLDLVCEGHSNKEVARLLGISPRTVEIHRSHAFSRIGATSTANAVNIVRRTEIAALRIDLADLRARLDHALRARG